MAQQVHLGQLSVTRVTLGMVHSNGPLVHDVVQLTCALLHGMPISILCEGSFCMMEDFPLTAEAFLMKG
jgi:hypothetical protein